MKNIYIKNSSILKIENDRDSLALGDCIDNI